MLELAIAQRVREALFSQKYNLLLGAGVSLDSTDQRNETLLGAEDLRKELCAISASRDSSPLWRVAGLLTVREVDTYITSRYNNCKAGPTLRALTQFAWKMAFTLNIDDALEDAYESDSRRLQSLVPVNYTRGYETFRNPQELPLIHLHGSVRLPQDKYVFSLQEYVAVQRTMNNWVHALSGLIISEPFIIAGTALFEPDLEYFLAYRPSSSQVLARAPTILVEPYPDAGTRKDCERLNLVLVKATLVDFLAWLTEQFGPAPSPLMLRQPLKKPRVMSVVSTHASTAFWADFEFVQSPAPPSSSVKPSAFHFGRPPTWQDIAKHIDVPLQEQLTVMDEVRRWADSSDASQVLCMRAKAGAGKSTTVRRICSELAAYNLQIFFIRATGGVDLDAATEFLTTVRDPIFLATDSLAEHGDELVQIMTALSKTTKRVCILGAEREYRMRLVSEVLEGIPTKLYDTGRWRVEETTELVKRYNALGLVADAEAIKDPRRFAKKLAEDTVAEAVCRILNDFRPLRAIVRSLWNDTFANARPAYLAVAVAYYCHPVGIRRDIVLSHWKEELLSELGSLDAPLGITFNPDDDAYLIPGNGTLARLLVEEMARAQTARLLDVAAQLANALAPYVTRHTIKQRTPEARLAGRLFDADGVLPDLLGDEFEGFYDLTYDKWSWNSRYWEQRALSVSRVDMKLAIQHARHAVGIERHPFPMTTLAKVLFSAAVQKPLSSSYFNEALGLMEETIRIESNWELSRTRKAYRALFDGVLGFLGAGGSLAASRRRFLEHAINDAKRNFPGDGDIGGCATDVAKVIDGHEA
jgi:hypothetical protein